MTPTGAGDGRTARAQRTREAVIDALTDLLRDGELDPNAQEIADRAGVSMRSIYVHFASLEDLHRAVAEQVTAEVLGLLSPIDPQAALADRIASISAQRAVVNEQIGPFRRASALREPSSPVLAGQRAFARKASREQVARVFDRELGLLDPDARPRRVAAIDAAISGESWDLMRLSHRFSADEAELAMRESLERLLAS
jgi:AcrR family transcriptional regulator